MMHEKGTILDPAAVATIKTGVTTSAEVRQLLGSPTLINAFREERWVYIQDRRYRNIQRTFSRVANRLEITFDAEGVVAGVKRNFDDALLDPNDLPVSGKNRERGWWSWFWDWENADIEPAYPPRAEAPPFDPDKSGLTAQEGEKRWWERVFSWNRPSTSTEVAPPPDTTFSDRDTGWWQGLFRADPSVTAPAEAASGAVSGGDVAPSGGAAGKGGGASPTPAAGGSAASGADSPEADNWRPFR
ncbi:MAG: outer membrane protein assembly factor BamE [Magnetococcales bacterium]|nr:outer membrane protein assembly factor BamE [Magnetococcales bacterium]